MRTINVDGIPEPLVKALENQVRNIRLVLKKKSLDPCAEITETSILTRPGEVVGGNLRREDAYEDIG
jgi:hypothetical protein